MKKWTSVAWLLLMTATMAVGQTYSGTSYTLNGTSGVGMGQLVVGNGDAAACL